MAVRAVTTDLSAAYSGGSGEITDADTTTDWIEPSGTGPTSGDTYSDVKSYDVDTEFKIEGTAAIGAAWTTNSPERGGVFHDHNATFTVPTDGAILVWMWFIAPSALSSYSIGGMWVGVGNTNSAFNVYRVSGNDFAPAPKGGWYCFAVDPSQTAERYEQVGSPNGSWTFVGGGVACPTAMSRGLTHLGIDAIRVGRCKLVVVGGTSTDPDADFSSSATLLEAQGSGKFGIFEEEGGSFFMQGLLQIGDNTTTGECDFTDSNKTINIRNTPAVGPNFNKIELQNGSAVTSNVSLTSCAFANLGVGNAVASTASRGDWANTDDVNLTLATCSFTDMGTFLFKSNSTITGTTFRRCDKITAGTASFTNCIIENSIVADFEAAVEVSDIDNYSGGSITTNTGNGHAIEVTAAAGGNWTTETSGYRAGTTGSPITPFYVGSTANGNETIFLDIASGTVSISVSGVTTPSVALPSGSTATVNVTGFRPTLTLTGLIANSEVRIYETGTTTVFDTGVENSGTSYAFQYDYPAVNVDIVIHNVDYEYIKLENIVLGAGDASLPIQQVSDRWYSNP